MKDDAAEDLAGKHYSNVIALQACSIAHTYSKKRLHMPFIMM